MPDHLEFGILGCKSSDFCIKNKLLKTNDNQNVVFSTGIQLLFFVQLSILSTQSKLKSTTHLDPRETIKSLFTNYLLFHKVCHLIDHFLPVLPIVFTSYFAQRNLLHALWLL